MTHTTRSKQFLDAACWASAATLLLSAHFGVFSDSKLDGHVADHLRENGFTPTKVGGYAWFECGIFDLSGGTKYEAINQAGEPVKGAVCQNPFTRDMRITID